MRKGSVISVYRDGVLGRADDHAENVLSLAPSDVNLTIGSHQSGGNPGPGSVDDFRIYDRALTADEIEALSAGT